MGAMLGFVGCFFWCKTGDRIKTHPSILNDTFHSYLADEIKSKKSKVKPSSPFNLSDNIFLLVKPKETGEGNGTLLQYSCLENTIDRGAW